jgi:hypothetical protein
MATDGQQTNAYDYEAITIADTAIGFTAAKLAPENSEIPSSAFCTLETAQIRYRVDGGTPTASVGHLLEIGQSLILRSLDNMKNFRAIRTGSTSASLKVTYER